MKVSADFTKASASPTCKNLATKEDIAEITRRIESVRAEYAKQLQMLSHQNTSIRDAVQRRHQLSMAALDKRLEAHQEAYYLWRQMLSKAYDEDNFAFFKECETWWEKHGLYLSAEAEDAFVHAYRVGLVLKQSGGNEGMWKILRSAGSVIRTAAQLPAPKREWEEWGQPLSPTHSGEQAVPLKKGQPEIK